MQNHAEVQTHVAWKQMTVERKRNSDTGVTRSRLSESQAEQRVMRMWLVGPKPLERESSQSDG
jgi:hypothetical protein